MDIKAFADKILQFLKKYRYAVLVVVVGLVLMSIPDRNSSIAAEDIVVNGTAIEEISLEEKLSDVLSQVNGAGKVRVILTIAAGEEVLYQTDDDISSEAESSSKSANTVTVTNADRNESGLIRQVNPEIYQGAIVVCQGADDPSVQLAIVDAVSKLTGLGANRISVLKMK